MVKDPDATVLPTELPETMPCMALAATAVLAVPPVNLPVSDKAKSLKKRPIFVWTRMTPKNRNRKINFDEICSGVQLHIVDRDQVNSLYTGITVLETIASMYPHQFTFICNEQNDYFFDLLAGTKKLRQIILEGRSKEFFQSCEEQLESFKKLKNKYILYQ